MNKIKSILTRELLSVVFGKEVALDDNIQITETIIHYSNVTHMSEINIYELANKCKIWALTQNCSIMSTFKHTFGHARVEWYEKGHFDKFNQARELNFYSSWFKEENEALAVISASQWILDQVIGVSE